MKNIPISILDLAIVKQGGTAKSANINVSDLASGVYMIEITTDSNLKQIRKFIVN